MPEKLGAEMAACTEKKKGFVSGQRLREWDAAMTKARKLASGRGGNRQRKRHGFVGGVWTGWLCGGGSSWALPCPPHSLTPLSPANQNTTDSHTKPPGPSSSLPSPDPLLSTHRALPSRSALPSTPIARLSRAYCNDNKSCLALLRAAATRATVVRAPAASLPRCESLRKARPITY
jgi:hypothetical protein